MVYFVIIFCFGKLFSIDLKLLFLVLNVNIGGLMMVCGMVIVKGWSFLVVFSIFVGIFGIVIVIFLGVGFGLMIFSYM